MRHTVTITIITISVLAGYYLSRDNYNNITTNIVQVTKVKSIKTNLSVNKQNSNKKNTTGKTLQIVSKSNPVIPNKEEINTAQEAMIESMAEKEKADASEEMLQVVLEENPMMPNMKEENAEEEAMMESILEETVNEDGSVNIFPAATAKRNW